MKIEKLKPGMTVYSLTKHKMGHTTINTISLYEIRIISVDVENKTVTASWNSNPVKEYSEYVWSKWRIKQPKLIKSVMGYYRLARRGE